MQIIKREERNKQNRFDKQNIINRNLNIQIPELKEEMEQTQQQKIR